MIVVHIWQFVDFIALFMRVKAVAILRRPQVAILRLLQVVDILLVVVGACMAEYQAKETLEDGLLLRYPTHTHTHTQRNYIHVSPYIHSIMHIVSFV